MSSASRRSGFTLLEIMVTLAIFGVVLSIVYGVFSQTLAGKDLAERRADETASARSALSRIALDLENARPLPGGSPPPAAIPAGGATPTPTPTPAAIPANTGLFLGRIRTENHVPMDDMAFTAMLRRPTAITFAASDLGIVHYFIDEVSPQSKVYGLYREAVFALNDGSFDPDKADPTNSTLILAGVSAFDLSYFDGSDWVQEWNSLDPRNFAPAPYGVEITLSVTNEQGETETYQTAVDLPFTRNLKGPQVPGLPTPTPRR